ncbi:MAG: penicillin-binding protein 2 [Clostridiales bacterium]|nr:penicillin-binding protein 2 [Clostridiales bacterium]
MKRERPNPKANRSLVLFACVVTGLFLCLIGYLGYFLQTQRESVINNSYNARLDKFAERVVRGDIRSRDGEVLSYTRTGEDGAEQRVYPYGELFAHPVGYADYGRSGLEALVNFYLLSSHTSPAKQLLNELSGSKNTGDNVTTTLDVGLQQAADEALGGRKGAVVALDPRTGQILAMVSRPSFDPNTLAEDWDSLISGDNTEAQLLNRVSQGLYPPGSVFKLVTVLEYIREYPDNWQDFMFDCDGVYEYGDYSISCYHGNAHGQQTLPQAFANSCNGAFASIGLELDAGTWRSLAGDLLFNGSLPLEIAYSKSSFSLSAESSEWEVLQTAIGQGGTLMSPLHAAILTAAIANGGTLMTPYLIDYVESAAGEEQRNFAPTVYGELMSKQEAEILTELMRGVVAAGTGSAVRTDAYTAAGKTGSAEYQTGKETHACFTGFAPVEDPEIVVTVVVEEGGSGGQTAAPVARAVFDTYFR